MLGLQTKFGQKKSAGPVGRSRRSRFGLARNYFRVRQPSA
ncbi:hypothetical protein NMD1_02662 [Novosphingobium sp. MD-1]|nr:hypothetical protein NMD1_02662 [Novosphingobium sp. MD-1]